MKSNFKQIIIGIIAALVAVFAVQLFWLKGLYHSIEAEMEKSVIECLETANLKELQYRVDSLDTLPEGEKQGGEISLSFSSEGAKPDTDKEETNLVKTKRYLQNGDTIQEEKEKVAGGFNLEQLTELFTALREGMQQAVGEIAPIQLGVAYQHLRQALEAKGIQSEVYNLAIVDVANDTVMAALNPLDREAACASFDYVFNTEQQLAYRVYLEPLTRTVLIQMLGILATTFVIVCLLAFAFWYLIRTIVQLTTLEEMKDDFTNNMTHELKTPIAVAYSATDALLNFGAGEVKEKRDKYLGICKEQLENLEGLVEQILAMSLEQRQRFVLKKEEIAIGQMLELLVEQHRLKANKEVVFTIDVPPHDRSIYADRIHFGNVVSNLIENAIKYSNTKVEIGLAVRHKNGFDILTVSDTGVGIAADKQRYVFDKFYRVPQGNKHNAKGYGLGLFYVKTIVEKHGGELFVESVLEKGSTFTIKLPSEE